MIILGINAYHGDSSACVVIDGKLVAAIEEERIRRIKHWAGFPSEAIRFCLDCAGVKLSEVDHIAIGRDPSAHLHKKALFALQKRPSFAAIKERLANMGRVRDLKATLAEALEVDPQSVKARLHNVEHHRARMASHSEGVEMVWEGGHPEMGPAFSEKWVERYGPVRTYEEPLEQKHKDIARSVQAITAEI